MVRMMTLLDRLARKEYTDEEARTRIIDETLDLAFSRGEEADERTGVVEEEKGDGHEEWS